MNVTKLEQFKDSNSMSIVYKLTIPIRDFDSIYIDPVDNRYLRDCEESGLLSDKLLGLSFIVRKIEDEWNKKKT